MSPQGSVQEGALSFFREVAKYFMDFLETDFHKRKFPRRVLKNRNNDNLLIGVSLKKYDTFLKPIHKQIQAGFTGSSELVVKKNQYKTKLPKSIFDLIQLQISKLTPSELNQVLKDIGLCIEQQAALQYDEFDSARSAVLENITTLFYEGFVHPFIQSLEKPLKNQELGDSDDVFLLETDLTEILVNLIEKQVTELLVRTIAKDKVNFSNILKDALSIADLKVTLTTYFENLRVADLYSELNELARNQSILDKQELYLYFGEIGYKGTRYPIFYIPLNMVQVVDSYSFEFDSQIYINKKALEYIVQESNAANGARGSLKTVTERILYVANLGENLPHILQSIVNELVDFFDVRGSINFSSGEEQQARGALVQLSNSCSIALFDKSDEALVNDYEEILQEIGNEGGDLGDTFNTLLNDFLQKNPRAFASEIEDEWDSTSTSDKLVFTSPIPLNSEQLQILKAISKPDCKYIVVEGPPGTGKSHTITAIIFEQILNSKSVLVLSDKKEALDVVEKNITETMNKVRFDQKFQNPILRLGKTGNTYNQILSRSSISDIKTHYRAVKKNYDTLEETIKQNALTLKEDIESEALAYEDIDLNEIQELIGMEASGKFEKILFDLDEIVNNPDIADDFIKLRESIQATQELINSKDFEKLATNLSFPVGGIQTLFELNQILIAVNTCAKLISEISKNFGGDVQIQNHLSLFKHFKSEDIEELKKYWLEYANEKKFLVGYAFSKKKLRELDSRFTSKFSTSTTFPSENPDRLFKAYQILDSIRMTSLNHKSDFLESFDPVMMIHELITDPSLSVSLRKVNELNEKRIDPLTLQTNYPVTFKNLGIKLDKLSGYLKNKLTAISEEDFEEQIRFIYLKAKTSGDFSRIPAVAYDSRKKNIEELVITQVAYNLDGRVIDFYENSKNDAEMLRNVIKSKQKFPKNEFSQLKNAFPCILAGIRDYAEYIPLQREMFDLVVIDEASQVSLAQAFPALIRAKKVLILGDRKQFSNVKANQARSDTNREYLSGLSKTFKQSVSTESSQITRLQKFNIKTSVLEFFEFISNYSMQLRKHFRGYKEIISYSNKYFYNNSLQVMKIRGKSIDEVIKFSYVKATEKDEIYQNTNKAEIDFVVDQLLQLKDQRSKQSVGIITPHTNQQKLFVEIINKLPEKDYFYSEMKLKIMTFDTCQGEERDTIFYSMVASKYSDKLWGIFIKDLDSVDIEEDGQIKAQRLNVGFSRGKECIHFVLSKPIDEFNGSIGEALRHYQNELEEAKKERSASETDARSGMEPEVLNWFYQTKFWKSNSKKIDFIPGFEIGKYLKQLDPTYTHPMYKVDFLLVFKPDNGRELKIVIEYDGFYEHFKGNNLVNATNYQDYLTEDDIYRQKVLESYGYKFVRINKFNSGSDPVDTLNERLIQLTTPEVKQDPLMFRIHETIENLQNGDLKLCPKCKDLRTPDEFKDSNLSSGYGRFCSTCKTESGSSRSVGRGNRGPKNTGSACPLCGARMTLRTGRYGHFYGCTRYPYCKGKRSR